MVCMRGYLLGIGMIGVICLVTGDVFADPLFADCACNLSDDTLNAGDGVAVHFYNQLFVQPKPGSVVALSVKQCGYPVDCASNSYQYGGFSIRVTSYGTCSGCVFKETVTGIVQ